MPNTNRLKGETSPYLLQHAHQPVNWHPWGEEAFELARNQDKLVLISIGYAACHWCHVMAHESFDDSEVAAFMNQHFIAIKVDREEHPDVDQYYMDAVQLLTGQGGWPLNCFALPDGSPVFGGTYFPKDRWLYLMESLVRTYEKQSHEIQDLAAKLQKGMKKQLPKTDAAKSEVWESEQLLKTISRMETYFDHDKGGIRGAPKFPLPSLYLPIVTFYKDLPESFARFLKISLTEMATGAIFDHLGGGFARYSVDEDWFVPHFEKMLYDNAQLISVYSQATEVTNIPYFALVAERAFAFLSNDLKHESGLFYASLDADSEGEEGAYYVWTKQELEGILGDLFPAFALRYGITEGGNWEDGKNLLHIAKSTSDVAKERQRGSRSVHMQLQYSLDLLSKERKKRVPPATDTKVLTAWNALLVAALVDLSRGVRNSSYLDYAREMINTLWQHSFSNGTYLRRVLFTEKVIPGNLEDYAYLGLALTKLYESTASPEYAIKAKDIAEQAIAGFWDDTRKLFRLSHAAHPVDIMPSFPVSDNVMPSGNAVFAYVLKVLGFVFEEPSFTLKAAQLHDSARKHIEKVPVYGGFWLSTANASDKPSEVVVIGPEAESVIRQMKSSIPRNAVVLVAEKQNDMPWVRNRWRDDNSTYIYICYTGQCKAPTTDVNEAIRVLESASDS
jgi:uncharacterized protein YyaL (SSP411 family)